jgi:hypothetical protein
MNQKEFIGAIQSRTARVAVSASSVRGAGGKGVVKAARNFLRQLDLMRFAVSNSTAFATELDRATNELRLSLPRGAQHWGVARKVLNIFLLDCFYTSYLGSAFHLDRCEALMELPLDSITAKQLKSRVGRGVLPPWSGVKHVTPAVNARFQEVAATQAAEKQTARVHLDAIWWSVGRDGDAT